MDIIVDIMAATICFMSSCYPALVGKDTPVGEFQAVHYIVDEPGYGGDLLLFKLDGRQLYAIHRVLDIPGQQRLARLRSPDPSHRNSITAGCINVDPDVYDRLIDCCSDSKIIIK